MSFIRNDHRITERDGKLFVLYVEYRKDNLGLSAATSFTESGLWGPALSLQVYAVPREHNSAIRVALKNAGLAEIAAWLTTSHYLEFWFSVDANEFSYIELDYRRIPE